MSTATPVAMIKELRHLLAAAISKTKAYDVPTLCRRLGLRDGEPQEASASKHKYAQKRLNEITDEQVITSARKLIAEESHFELAEQLSKIDEWSGAAVTSLTRGRIISLFEQRPIAMEIESIKVIRDLWPISSMPSPLPSVETTLEDYLYRHTIRNDDMSNRDVLEALGLLDCSRTDRKSVV